MMKEPVCLKGDDQPKGRASVSMLQTGSAPKLRKAMKETFEQCTVRLSLAVICFRTDTKVIVMSLTHSSRLIFNDR